MTQTSRRSNVFDGVGEQILPEFARLSTAVTFERQRRRPGLSASSKPPFTPRASWGVCARAAALSAYRVSLLRATRQRKARVLHYDIGLQCERLIRG